MQQQRHVSGSSCKTFVFQEFYKMDGYIASLMHIGRLSCKIFRLFKFLLYCKQLIQQKSKSWIFEKFSRTQFCLGKMKTPIST